MRIWQTFRTFRGAAASVSALLALFVGVLEMRSLFAGGSDGLAVSWQTQAASAAIAAASLGGAIFAMRRGNLVILLVAWAFVLGAMFTTAVEIAGELAGARGQANILMAVLSVNFELAATVLGLGLALLAALPKKRVRASTGNPLSIGE